MITSYFPTGGGGVVVVQKNLNTKGFFSSHIAFP